MGVKREEVEAGRAENVARRAGHEVAREAKAAALAEHERQIAEYRPPHGLRSDDFARVAAMLKAIGGCTDETVTLMAIDGEPHSKARPRFGGAGHVYIAKKQAAMDRELKARFTAAFRDKKWDGNVAVACLFYRSHQGRIDVDNMLKQVMDCANGICWTDDYQVTGKVGVLELDRLYPRTIIAMARHETTMKRDLVKPHTCRGCGKEFRRKFNRSEQVYCSRVCMQAVRGEASRAVVKCRQCEKEFRRRTPSQVFCSIACRAEWGPRDVRKLPKHTCHDCGKVIANRKAARCRECWRGYRRPQGVA